MLKKVYLKDLVDRKIGYGIVQPGSNVIKGTPVIKVNNIINGLNEISSLDLTTDEISQKYKRTILQGGELVISLVGTVGKTAIVPISLAGCNLVRATGLIDIKDVLLCKWVKYYIDSIYGQTYIKNNLNTTVQPTLNIDALEKMEIPVFSSEYLKRATDVLSSLDDKIELNNKINANLEQQAQALFKSWFVDFEPFGGEMPSGWKEISLGEICECILGGTPNREKKEYWNGNIPWINSGEVNLFRIIKPSEYITKDGLENSSTKLLPKKTTVIAITGATLGQISLLEINSCANQSVVGVIPNKELSYCYIYPMIKEKIHELLSHQTGGAQQHINKQNVQNLPIILPSKNVLETYTKTIEPIYEQIAINCFENKKLSNLRDTLLSKLMNGEIYS